MARVVDELDLPPAFESRTAEVNGVTIHYVSGGRGDAVVLLHGWPQSWREWKPVLPALADKYTVIAPDLRGMGDSSMPDAGYDAQTVAEDVRALCRKLGHPGSRSWLTTSGSGRRTPGRPATRAR